MTAEYAFIPNLDELMSEIPADSIVSRTVHSDDRVKVVLFGFAAGQELSEHTASMPAVLHFLSGEARLTFGSDEWDARPGTWVHMPANLAHSVLAATPTVMLLLLLKGGAQAGGQPAGPQGDAPDAARPR